MERTGLSNTGYAALVVLAVGTGVAWWVHPRGWVAVACAGAVLGIGVGLPLLILLGTRLRHRPGITRARRNEGIFLEFEMYRAVPFPLSGASVSGWPGVSPAHVSTKPTPDAPKRRSGVAVAEVRMSDVPRGAWKIASLSVSTAFPVGIWTARRRVLATDATLIVWPALLPVRAPRLAPFGATKDVALVSLARDTHGEPGGVRLFRRGDAMRHVHWAQTARQDRLVSRELYAPVSHAILITLVLNDDEGPSPTPARPVARERAIDATASLFEHWLQGGNAVGLRVGKCFLVPAQGSSHRTRGLDALAVLPATGPVETTDDRDLRPGWTRVLIQSGTGTTTTNCLTLTPDQILGPTECEVMP